MMPQAYEPSTNLRKTNFDSVMDKADKIAKLKMMGIKIKDLAIRFSTSERTIHRALNKAGAK